MTTPTAPNSDSIKPVSKLAQSAPLAGINSAPKKPTINIIGLEKSEYKGGDSTLCNGCGHDSISAQIITACYELGVQPEGLIKFSGIGCSSKSPAYFMSRSFGFNTLHGRMPSVAQGALLANHSLQGIGVSGDGDTGSIGLGQFMHLVRRNLRMVYIIENNGVYGLTKGQFSATTDVGQELKHAGKNELPPIDLCREAVMAGCGFVARSFAGDPKQVVPLLKAALSHRGTAVLDIISPCVTFNNKDDSTKGYTWGREHDERINDIQYVPIAEEIKVDYAPGEAKQVEMHDGSSIVLRKIDDNLHDPTNKMAALKLLTEAHEKQEFITGLMYADSSRESLAEIADLKTPLAHRPKHTCAQARRALRRFWPGCSNISKSKRVLTAVWRFPLTRIAAAAVFFVATAAAFSALLSGSAFDGVPEWAALLVWIPPMLLAYVLFVRLFEWRNPVELALRNIAEFPFGLAIGAGIFSLIVGAMALLGLYRVVAVNSPALMLASIGIGLAPGIIEELIFRGVLYRILEESLGTWITLVITSLIFGFLHAMNPGATLFSSIAIALEAGTMLGITFTLTKRLWLAFGIHTAWNFVQGGIYGIRVSGIAIKGWLEPRIDGPELLTGGAFGAEASVIAIGFCLALFAVMLAQCYRRGLIVAPFWSRSQKSS